MLVCTDHPCLYSNMKALRAFDVVRKEKDARKALASGQAHKLLSARVSIFVHLSRPLIAIHVRVFFAGKTIFVHLS